MGCCSFRSVCTSMFDERQLSTGRAWGVVRKLWPETLGVASVLALHVTVVLVPTITPTIHLQVLTSWISTTKKAWRRTHLQSQVHGNKVSDTFMWLYQGHITVKALPKTQPKCQTSNSNKTQTTILLALGLYQACGDIKLSRLWRNLDYKVCFTLLHSRQTVDNRYP